MVGVENRERNSFSETFDAHMFALFKVRKVICRFLNLIIYTGSLISRSSSGPCIISSLRAASGVVVPPRGWSGGTTTPEAARRLYNILIYKSSNHKLTNYYKNRVLY